jgi:hypothetical protein
MSLLAEPEPAWSPVFAGGLLDLSGGLRRGGLLTGGAMGGLAAVSAEGDATTGSAAGSGRWAAG